MSNYSKHEVSLVYSDQSDYSLPLTHVRESMTLTPDKVQVSNVTATAAGLTVELSGFSSITSLLVKNTSTSLTVTATWTSTTSCTQTIGPGKCILLSSVTVANDLVLTESTSAAVCRVAITGA